MWTKIQAFWRRHKDRYLGVVERYGLPVIVTAILLRILSAVAVVAAVRWGWQIDQVTASDTGLFVAAWVFVYPLAPVRWILAAAIAPPVVNAWRRWRGKETALPPVLDEP